MRALINGCRRWAVAASLSVLGAIVAPMIGTGSAQADTTFQFRSDGGSSASRNTGSQYGRSKRMRLGATTPRRQRESLTGGSPEISEGRTARRGRHAQRHGQRRPRGVRTASLGAGFTPPPSVGQSLTGGGIKWVASSGCLNSSLRAVIAQVASSFGPVTVNSTCRGRRHNSRVGGARHSHHLTGNAVDFRVRGAGARSVYAFLRSHASVGGLKLYRRGFFHIDTGARRTW